MRRWRAIGGLAGVTVALALVVGTQQTANALEIVLHDVAPDRIERQRRFSRGEVPLPGTPDLAQLDARLAERGLAKGRPIFIRVFKEESELELWLQNGQGTFSLLATYPICHWHGTLGPKLKEGDRQSPEGFYSVGMPQTRLVGRWRRAFNLGFPNVHDQLLSRTGSHILVHGGCSSVGCFAMTDQVQNEIYELAHAALSAGQDRFDVHVFPFRMTEANLARHAEHDWAHTWADLRPAYDSFERTRIPPAIAVCGVRYKVADGLAGETGSKDRRLSVLRPGATATAARDASVVLDESGRWLEPPCELEDEARRRSIEAGTPGPAGAAEATLTAAIGVPGEADEDRARSLLAGERAATSLEGPGSAAAARARRSGGGPKGARKPGDAGETGAESHLGGGFGSATFRGRDRATPHGG